MYLIDHSYCPNASIAYVLFDHHTLAIGPLSAEQLSADNEGGGGYVDSGDYYSETGFLKSTLSFAVVEIDHVKHLFYQQKLYSFAEHDISLKNRSTLIFEHFTIMVDGNILVRYRYILPFWRASRQEDEVTLDTIYPLRWCVDHIGDTDREHHHPAIGDNSATNLVICLFCGQHKRKNRPLDRCLHCGETPQSAEEHVKSIILCVGDKRPLPDFITLAELEQYGDDIREEHEIEFDVDVMCEARKSLARAQW